MKFSEINKFTHCPAQGSTVPLDYLEKRINDEIKDLNLQLEPDFQRGHVWSRDQQIAYVEYLLRGGQSGRAIYFNHPGWMGSFKGDFVLVDGLQRITACLAFLHDEIPAFGFLYSQYEDRIRMVDVNLTFFINTLQTKEEVLKWYLEMNSGGTPHTQEELDHVRKMMEAKNDRK